MQTMAQYGTYKVNSQKVLATANGINYTEGHFNKALRFLEFILGTQMSEAEKQESLQKTADKFQLNPQAIIDEVNGIDLQMNQFYQIKDIAVIAKMRSALISQLYAGAQNLTPEQQPFIIKLLYKYVPVLAFDAQNMLAFTYRDFEGLIYLMQFKAMMTGQNLQFTQQELIQTQTSLAQQFYYMTLEQKQNLCSMQIQYEYIYKVYNSLTPEQKQQWQNKVLNQQAYQYQNYANNSTDAAFQRGYEQQQKENKNWDTQWPDWVKTKADKQTYLQQMQADMGANNASMNMYYDTMMQTDTMWSNVIEDFGDTGKYWEYKGVEY
jgi:hypothetical protein